MKMQGMKVLLIAGLLAAPLAAKATVIDFNGVGTNFNDPATVSGFDFSYLDRDGWGIGTPGTTLAGNFSNGTEVIVCRDTRDNNCAITMAQNGGGVFSLNAFDGADAFRDIGGTTITVTGYLFGGGTVTQSFLTTANSYDTYILSGAFTNLVSVEFRGFKAGQAADIFMALDNIVANGRVAVPEPGTLALLGLGLAGLGAKRRKTVKG